MKLLILLELLFTRLVELCRPSLAWVPVPIRIQREQPIRPRRD